MLRLGKPDFIEIKSVTFCGESKVSNGDLERIKNPWFLGPGQTTSGTEGSKPYPLVN